MRIHVTAELSVGEQLRRIPPLRKMKFQALVQLELSAGLPGTKQRTTFTND